LLYISRNPVSPGVWNTLSPNAGQILVEWSRDARTLVKATQPPGRRGKKKSKKKLILGQIEIEIEIEMKTAELEEKRTKIQI
jgi:hypothetical protein